MDTQTVLIGIIIIMLGAFALLFRAQAKTATNAADAQAMINKRFEKLERDNDKLHDENAALVAKVASLETANTILMSTQSTERTLAEARAEKYGELQAKVQSLTAANAASRGESLSWQTLSEELRTQINGFPKQIADLTAIAQRLGAALPASEAASVEAEIDAAKPIPDIENV